MISIFVEPAIATLALIAVATLVGVPAMRKLITVYEAKHELRRGSTGWLRSIGGWSLIAFWLMTTWFVASIIGDWAVTADLTGALDRAWLRLRILLEIAAALAEADN